jgi:ATP-dependent RNA helicase DeaD
MLFSATMPDPIKRLAANYMKEPLDIIIKSGSPIPLDNIKQQVVECSDRNKEEALQAMIERDRPYLAIIFCRTKRRVSKLNEALQAAGYDCDELHGDLSQGKREAVMKRFRDAKLQLLVATDVAARGLDVEGITHIFNYDLPLDVDSYIHRIGRTGRAGGKGLAITFASPREYNLLDLIEHGISQRLDRRRYEKDEFGVGEFTAVQGGGSPRGGRRSGAPEPARAGRGGRSQGRSGGAPRAEAGARPGGRSRGKEAAGGWGTPAENRGSKEAAGGKRSAYGAAAPRGESAGKSAAKPRPGGGYGSFDARSNAAAAPAAGTKAGAGQRGGPSSGYSTNVARGAEAGGFSYGASKGAGSGSGYNPGGAQASPKHRANVARSNEAGAWSSSPPASKGGGSRGGSKGGKGGFGSGGSRNSSGGGQPRGGSGGSQSRGGSRGKNAGGSRGGRGSSR